MIHLDYRDSRPIYEQIRDGLRELIVTGAAAAGERLPSVREMAMRLAINPNTIQRAYRELEAEGYIASVAGKGSFVSEGDGPRLRRKAELLRDLGELAAQLRKLGADEEEIQKAVGGGGIC